MSETPIPILATGRTTAIATQVIELMKPQYEIIHMTLASSIKDELPFLLKGTTPPNPSSTLGSGNWSRPPQALLIGGGYQDSDVEEVVKLARSIDGAMEIPWLRADASKMPPPSGEPTPEEAAKYGRAVVQRFKDELDRLSREGKLGQGKGGIYLV